MYLQRYQVALKISASLVVDGYGGVVPVAVEVVHSDQNDRVAVGNVYPPGAPGRTHAEERVRR